MRGKGKPQPGASAGAAETVVAGWRNDPQPNQHPDETQAGTERQIYRGLTFIGVVRETTGGDFVAVVGEEVLGPYPSIKAATDVLLDVARAGAS